MRIGRFLGIVVVASLIAAGPAVAPDTAAASPPAPPFDAPVIVVDLNWDYDNVAIAYDVLPAAGAPYHPFDVSGGPSCMVPPVPYYLYDETAVGGTAVPPGPGSGAYPDDPNANYKMWEARGGAPGEYVVVVRWVNYCYRPTDVLPGPSDPPLPQEQAHPQGQPVDVTATVSVYEAGQASPSSTTVLGGVVIAGAERPANELATELGRVVLPPATVPEAATPEPTEATEAGPVAEASSVAPASAEEVAEADASSLPAEEEDASGAQDVDFFLGLLILLVIVCGVLATILWVLFLRSRAKRRKSFRRLPEPDRPVPPTDHDETMRRSMRGEPPPVPRWTHQAASTEMWDRPDPGPDDLPYSEGIEGPVIVLEQRGGWARIDWLGGSAWIPADKLGPLPPGYGSPSPPRDRP